MVNEVVPFSDGDRLPLTDGGLARLMLSESYQELAQQAVSGISPRADRHAEPGDFVEEALRLVGQAQEVLRWAVVFEREQGTSWADVGGALGSITRQSAQARYAGDVAAWRAPLESPAVVRLDGTSEDPRIPYPASDPEPAAARLDRWLLAHSDRTNTWADDRAPVSAHLERHSTVTALMRVDRYTSYLLKQQLVPDPQAVADAEDRRADLMEWLVREGDGTPETPGWIAEHRARAAALRASPGRGVNWDVMDQPPDLSQYSVLPSDAYEWFLSDHPWARAERIRRAEAYHAGQLENASQVRDWTDRIHGLDLQERYPNNPAIAENLRGLADLMRPIADGQQLRAHLDDEPDDVAVVRLRQEWVRQQHVSGEDAYEYPAHLTGPTAAAYPPPSSGFDRPDAST